MSRSVTSFLGMVALLVFAGTGAGPSMTRGQPEAQVTLADFVAETLRESGSPGQAGEHTEAVELPDRGLRVESRLYLPTSLKTVRLVMVIAPRGLGDNLYADPEVRAFALSAGTALLVPQFVNVAGVKGTLTPAARAEGLGAALRQFASLLKVPDLGAAPLIFWGHSAGAGTGTDLAPVLAARTIAIIRYHGNERGDDAALKQFPILFFRGGRDTSFDSESPGSLWEKGRAEGAPWTYALEPDAEHGDTAALRRAHSLLFPWIRAVVQRRLSSPGAAVRGISETDSWLGDLETGRIAPSSAYAARKSEASWLPDEQSAKGWQSVIGRFGG